jgi:uncharacterized protein YecA (UPF0149 family)
MAQLMLQEQPAARVMEVLAQEEGRQSAVKQGKVGRNDPCPCGSGLKYKKCHGP